jgi:hypothetical protein
VHWLSLAQVWKAAATVPGVHPEPLVVLEPPLELVVVPEPPEELVELAAALLEEVEVALEVVCELELAVEVTPLVPEPVLDGLPEEVADDAVEVLPEDVPDDVEEEVDVVEEPLAVAPLEVPLELPVDVPLLLFPQAATAQRPTTAANLLFMCFLRKPTRTSRHRSSYRDALALHNPGESPSQHCGS